jgi:hypothetical protein
MVVAVVMRRVPVCRAGAGYLLVGPGGFVPPQVEIESPR